MANTTQVWTTAVPGKSSSLFSEELVMKITWTFYFVIFPCICAAGISTNVGSIVIISRLGFKKSSNILLVSLALSDIMFLVGLNNVGSRVIFLSDHQVLWFSATVNYIIYLLYMAFTLVNCVGVYCSLVIPVLITAERLLAIFTPLAFKRIVTPARTVFVLSCLVFLFALSFVYDYILGLGFKQDNLQNVSVGTFYNTEQLLRDSRSGMYQLFSDCLNYMTGVVPVLVSFGSVVTGVKFALITNKRRQLTSGGVPKPNQKPSPEPISRTTKTLLIICLLYSICSSFSFLVEYVTRISGLTDDSLYTLLGLCGNLIMCLNSIGNFIVYVIVNKSFNITAAIVNCCRRNRQF